MIRALLALFGEPRERHPVQHMPPWPVDRRVAKLEELLALLWEQVWWMSLPRWKRVIYRLRGFRAPIARFYEEL